jgi:hypothetical protein
MIKCVFWIVYFSMNFDLVQRLFDELTHQTIFDCDDVGFWSIKFSDYRLRDF